MIRYTDQLQECSSCFKREHFLVTVVEKDSKSYYLTQCPKCKRYDEVKELTAKQAEGYKSKLIRTP